MILAYEWYSITSKDPWMKLKLTSLLFIIIIFTSSASTRAQKQTLLAAAEPLVVIA